ncbi:hypothetical protein BH11MYX1_BH11MYX1_30410 [soil metagenome]
MAKCLRTALFLFVASCSSHINPGVSEPETLAVPLTAATQSIAAAQIAHADLSPPWSLTASDGSGLALSRVEAKAVFEGPLAYTELHLWFHNPENRRREGTFQITLPEHASVSRFAMENEGQWMEAEVVEKQLARRAYDDFLHRRQDPALLEKADGNQFTAKVFPIAGNSDKHIVISFSQELPGSRYTLPLRGLPKINQIEVSLATMAADGTQTTQRMNQHDWTPDRDFISDAPAAASAVMAGNLVVAQVAAVPAAAASEAPKAMTLLVDTSASRALGYAAYVKSVRGLIEKVAAKYGAQLPLEVIAFDQDHEAIYRGTASGWGDAQDQKLSERGAAGASDLQQALRGLSVSSRLVVITDGVITAGAEHAELAAAAKAVKAERLDIVLAGGIRDDAAAAELVRAGQGHAGAVLDLDDGAGAVAEQLAQPVRVDVKVEVPGAAWVYPSTISSARAGTSTMVFARMQQPVQSLEVIMGGERQTLAIHRADQPLVERALGGAEIRELEAALANAEPTRRGQLKQAIAQKSIANRVISSETSLLVLESAADYARYGIEQKALADVLVIGAHGLERRHRELPTVRQIAEPAAKPTLGQTTEKRKFDKREDREARADASKDRKNNEREPASEAAPRVDGLRGGDADPGGGASTGARPNDLSPSAPAPSAAAGPSPTRRAMAPAPVAPPPPSVEGDSRASASATGRAMALDEDRMANQPIQQQGRDWPPANSPVALTVELAEIEHSISAKQLDRALSRARDWHAKEPGNVLALIGLGDALEAKGSAKTAARVYGSIIDLFPGRADMRRFAGERLARLRTGSTGDLVIDTYRRAVADRPDHMTGHRLLAYALVRARRQAEAFEAVLAALDQPYRNDSYAGGLRTLGDDAGMIGAAFAAAHPDKRKDVIAELAKRGLSLATAPSTRFILYWETDANDVDFHIQDAQGGHAFYGAKQLPSGGELYADITTGYGPECFAIAGIPKAGPYNLSINYYSQGPMGYGMGLLEIQKFDGKGGLTFEDRPYVIMNDHAYVDLGMFQ